MSQFYGSVRGSASSEATRQGGKSSGIEGHIRGWDQGIRVSGYVDDDGNEVFEVYTTGGSNDASSKVYIGELKDGVFTPAVSLSYDGESFVNSPQS